MLDQRVATRAALELAGELIRRDQRDAAVQELIAVCEHVDSVPTAWAAARASQDVVWQAELRSRAPTFTSAQAADDFGRGSADYGNTAEEVLRAAAAADIPIDSALLPAADEPIEVTRNVALAKHLRDCEAGRWPVSLEELESRIRAARSNCERAQTALAEHRSKEPVMRHVYEARLAELEMAASAATAEVAQLEKEAEEARVEDRAHLLALAARLDPREHVADDVGVIPLPPGLNGLTDR